VREGLKLKAEGKSCLPLIRTDLILGFLDGLRGQSVA
jgi:hypothetical protein